MSSKRMMSIIIHLSSSSDEWKKILILKDVLELCVELYELNSLVDLYKKFLGDESYVKTEVGREVYIWDFDDYRVSMSEIGSVIRVPVPSESSKEEAVSYMEDFMKKLPFDINEIVALNDSEDLTYDEYESELKRLLLSCL